MTLNLPTSDFYWLKEDEIENLDVRFIPKNGSRGYVLEVDLSYPAHLHDSHSDYPLAPERRTITNEVLSPYNVKHFRELQGDDEKPLQRHSSSKLVASLHDKHRYIVHYRTLQTYLDLGLELVKIHRVVGFKQTAWLQDYINFNSEKRKNSTSQFEKVFFKLMNNSIFGKTMEDIRKRKKIKIVNNSKKFKREVAKSSFESFTVFNKDLVGISHKHVVLSLNKPVYCGMTILDLSKTIMYEHYYGYLKKKYEDKISLLCTDTDSLITLVETKDIYEDMWEDRHLYDLSNFPKSKSLYDITNKSLPGTFKDETAGHPISEFVGLRAKMYAYRCPTAEDEHEKKVAKGIQKSTIEKDLTFEHYKTCLIKKTQSFCKMDMIRSSKHELFT